MPTSSAPASSSSSAPSVSSSPRSAAAAREVEVDRIARHRGALRERAARFAQRGDLLLQRAGDRLRHAHPRRLGRHRAARGVLARQLLQEERVPAAGLVDLAAHGTGDLGAEQRLGVGEGQRAERVLDHRAVALRGGQGGRQQRPDRRGPEGERERHAPARRPPQQVRDELQRGVVGPVQVVERDHDRLDLRERLEQDADGAVRAVALVLQAGRDAADGRQDRGELGQLVADQPLQPVDAEELGVLGQRVLPDAEGQLALELGRAAGQHQRSGPVGAGRQLVEQARLADPALAREGQHGAAPAPEFFERGVDGRDLGPAPEQRSVEGGHPPIKRHRGIRFPLVRIDP